ncbi:hypothetical protein N0V92_007076 [Colletotrichum tropicale]|nr:hypothetical protein N0V92_007076 [Colletotrichum tropicale]
MDLQSQEQVHERAEKPVDAQSKTSGGQSDVPNASEKKAAIGDLPGWKAFLIWLAISFGVLCTFLDEGIIATAIPRITDDFGSLKDVGWYGSAYQMTLCAFQLVFGRMYNQFNIKIVFLASLGIFEIGSLICAVSPSSAVFIIGRAIAGLGASGLQSGSLVLISAALPAKKLPLYLGAIGMLFDMEMVPLWFQAIQGDTPEQSGVHYLALCLAFILTIFLSGWGVTKIGYYQPFMLAGTVLVAVGAGLLSTLQPQSGAGQWISYQVVAGLGIGASTQQAAVAVQSTLAEGDVAIGVAVVLFFQCFGPTAAITIAQAVFSSDLAAGISAKIPGVDFRTVQSAGATQLAGFVSDGKLEILMKVYNHAITRAFLVAAAMAAASVVGVIGIGLRRIQADDEVVETDHESKQ